MWYSEMVTILRHMIDDVGTSPKYDDDRLAQLILVGAQFAQLENSFSVSYMIDLEGVTLEPDPTTSDPKDNGFINLTLLRAACLLASSGLGKSASAGMLVVEGPYRFDNRGGAATSKALQVKTWCQAYADAKWENTTSSTTPGEAIIGPYRSMDYKNYAYGSGYLYSPRDTRH